jgi:hypothetical protein
VRDIALRPAAARMVAAVAVGLTATLAIAVPVAAASAAQPPTIATLYTPNQIGVSQTAGVTYTITDPNASGSLYQVSFTDTLPATTTIDDPASVTDSGCGSAIAVTANPGASTVSVADVTVKAGTPCTVSVAIDGNSAGTESDAYSAAVYTSSSASYAVPGAIPASDLTPASLQVLGAPIVAVTTPKANAVYTYGEAVKASYSCTAASGDSQSQLECVATDDLGNTINSGQKLDTTVPGQHELDIQAISGVTGDTTEVAVDYTVLPDSAFTISKVKAGAGGALSFKLALPGAGKVVVKELSGSKVLHSKTLKVSGKKTVGVTLGAASVPKATLEVTYTPTGGRKHTETKRVKL